MKKIFTYSRFVLLALLAIFAVSCEKEKLSEVIVAEEGAKVSLELPNEIEVSGGGNYSLDNSQLVLPLTIDFNGASTKAFTVKTTVNTDTVATLVANGALPAGTLPLQEGKFLLAPEVNIAYGVKSVGLSIVIDRSYLELNYGKDIAFALKMTDPSKGNSIASGKNSTIVVIKTGPTIDEASVHYIKFSNITPDLNIPLSNNNLGYSKGSQDISIPVELTLTGEAGQGFTVDLIRDMQVIDAGIAAGSIPANVAKLDDASWSISNPKVTFENGKNKATFNVNLRVMASISFVQKIAMGLRLSNPTKWQLAKSNTTLVVLFDPTHLGRKPFNATPFIIKGGVGAESDFIPASNYDLGGEGVAYHDNNTRDGGQFRRPDPVDIGDNNITVGWTESGEWLTYTVDVQGDGLYSLNAIIGSPNTDSQYSVYFGTTNVTGVQTARQTAGGYGDQKANYTLVTLKKGLQVMRFHMDRVPYDVMGVKITKLNAYDGKYSINGTITRNSANGPDTSLGGTITNGPVRNLVTAGTNRLQLVPIWKDGSNVGGIDLTHITIDPATNNVTVSSETNATVKNIDGAVNKYDPATKTFTLNFEWGTAPDTRSTSLTLKYTGNRP